VNAKDGNGQTKGKAAIITGANRGLGAVIIPESPDSRHIAGPALVVDRGMYL